MQIQKRNLILPLVLGLLLLVATGTAIKFSIDNQSSEAALESAQAEMDAAQRSLSELSNRWPRRGYRDDCVSVWIP